METISLAGLMVWSFQWKQFHLQASWGGPFNENNSTAKLHRVVPSMETIPLAGLTCLSSQYLFKRSSTFLFVLELLRAGHVSHSFPMKSRKKVAYGVMYTSATHAGLSHDVIETARHKQAAPMAAFL